MVEGTQFATNSRTRVSLGAKTDGYKIFGPKITANFGTDIGMNFGTDPGQYFGTNFGPNFGTD